MIVSRLKRLLILLAVLLAGGWGFLFSLANSEAVALDLVLMRLPEAALGVWVIGAFGVGGLCGLAVGSVAIWRARRARPHAPGDATSPSPQSAGG